MTLRIAAGCVFLFYSVYTRRDWIDLFDGLRTHDFRAVWTAFYFLLSTIAMLVVAILPSNLVIAWESAILAWIGYAIFFGEMLVATR